MSVTQTQERKGKREGERESRKKRVKKTEIEGDGMREEKVEKTRVKKEERRR